jgi:hypothetical protein
VKESIDNERPGQDEAPVLVEQTRKRKGLPLEPHKASEFIDNE